MNWDELGLSACLKKRAFTIRISAREACKPHFGGKRDVFFVVDLSEPQGGFQHPTDTVNRGIPVTDITDISQL